MAYPLTAQGEGIFLLTFVGGGGIMKSAKRTQYFTTISVCFYFDKNARSFLHTYSGVRSLFGDNPSCAFFVRQLRLAHFFN